MSGGVRMTPEYLVSHCKKNKLYVTPELNDVLYLHFQGFAKIENLEKYIGLKCLWLESNGISKIEGLENQKKLKSLFLQNNLITKIECLENCRELDTLNISHNQIKRVENCTSNFLPVLNTLNISHNYLRSFTDLELLKGCLNLSILDISHNQIDDILVLKALAAMPSLHVLTMTGNPVVNMIPNYRKTLILECKSLTYLDSRPVFPRDRACAEAWKKGGHVAEKKVHEQWNREERRKIRRSLNATLSLRRDSNGDPVKLIQSSDEEEGENKESGDSNSHSKKKSAMDIYEDQQKRLDLLYAQQDSELRNYNKRREFSQASSVFNSHDVTDKNNNQVEETEENPLNDLEKFENAVEIAQPENTEENSDETSETPEIAGPTFTNIKALIESNDTSKIVISKKPLIEVIGDGFEVPNRPEDLIQNVILSMSEDGDKPAHIQESKSIFKIVGSTAKEEPPTSEMKPLVEEIEESSEKIVEEIIVDAVNEETPPDNSLMFIASNENTIVSHFEEVEATPESSEFPALNFKLGRMEISSDIPKEIIPENCESMAWIDEPTSLLFPSIQYPSILMENQENIESQNDDPNLRKVLDLCHDQKKEAMQLFFLNETEQLMQLYDEAADKNLIDRIGDADIVKVQKMCEETDQPPKAQLQNPYEFPKIVDITQSSATELDEP